MTEIDPVTESVVKNARLTLLVEHMRNNNLTYVIGVYVAWQMGLLDSMITYGSGICS